MIELFGATLAITRPTKEPAPMPFTTSPIIPVLKLEPIPRPTLRERLTILVLLFAIVFLGVLLLFIVFVIRLLVAVFRFALVVVRFDFFLNPPLFIIRANFLRAASCLAVAIIKHTPD